MNIQLLLLGVFLFQKVICASDEKALEELQKDFFDYLLSENPEFASSIGDKRFDDQVDDYSLATFERWKDKVERVLKKLKKINRGNLNEHHKTDYDIFNNYLQTYLDGYKWRMYSALTPILNMSQPSSLKSLVSNRLTDTSNKQDFDNFIKRIQKYPTQLAQIKERMQKAIELKRTLHRVSMRGIPGLLDKITEGQKPEDSSIYIPFGDFLDNITTISEDDKFTLRGLAKSAIENYVKAVRDLKNFISNTYMKNTRPGLGVSTWNDGENYYRDIIKHWLSMNLTAEEIYSIGVIEVERISGEMKKIFKKIGINGTIKESFVLLNEEGQYSLKHGIHKEFGKIIRNKIGPELSQLFHNRSTIKVLARSIALGGKIAFYTLVPDNDCGYRYGQVNLNRFLANELARYNFMATALHEANPGHHLQITTAKTSDIPKFRREPLINLGYQVPTAFQTWTAYKEGWGSYAEYLGEGMGLYKSDVDMLGRYNMEMLRACRLVVDTGIHHYNWTRDQAIEYLSNYTSLGDTIISNEIDRYVSLPGQALSYKIGEMKFKELKKKAEDMLGEDFDIKDFHSTVLQNGPMSFSNLETILDLWIDKVISSKNEARLTSVSLFVLLFLIMMLLGLK